MTTLLGVLLALLLALGPTMANAAAAPAGPGGQGPQPAAPLQVPPGWQVHRGASGLVVMHPRGWRVQEGGGGSFLALRPGPDGATEVLALAQPMKVEGRALAVVEGIGQILPQVFPGVRVSRSRAVSTQPQVAEARLDYTASGRDYQGAALCFARDGQGMLFAAAARAELWAQAKAEALAVLQGFFYSQAPPGEAGPAGAQPPPLEPWRDPVEGAFSCPVPKGWRVEGGLRRFHAVDTRAELVAQSPDGGVLIRLGDAAVPPMALPSRMLTMTGFSEGSWYSPGYGARLLVQRYLPGAEFATRFYLPQRVGQVSQVQARPLPEVARRAQAVHAQAGLPIRVDTGDVSFQAATPQGQRRGYLFVQTLMVQLPGSPDMGNWQVEILYGYMAQAEAEPLAQATLAAMVQGFQVDPGWMARQAQLAGQVSNIVTKTNREITGIIRDAFAYRQQVQDRSAERFSRAFRGQVLIEDPNTGERFEVPSGSNYYWRSGGDRTFVGTETGDRPQWPGHWLERMQVLD